MKEIWKHLSHPFEPYYMVSNYGRVKSLPHIIHYNHFGTTGSYMSKPHLCNQYIDKDGYKEVSIRILNNKYRNVRTHILVAKLFIPNPHHYKYINHKNENRADEWASNLEWCTQSYNCEYGNHMIKNYLSSLYKNRNSINTKLLDNHDIRLIKKIINLTSTLSFIKK